MLELERARHICRKPRRCGWCWCWCISESQAWSRRGALAHRLAYIASARLFLQRLLRGPRREAPDLMLTRTQTRSSQARSEHACGQQRQRQACWPRRVDRSDNATMPIPPQVVNFWRSGPSVAPSCGPHPPSVSSARREWALVGSTPEGLYGTSACPPGPTAQQIGTAVGLHPTHQMCTPTLVRLREGLADPDCRVQSALCTVPLECRGPFVTAGAGDGKRIS